MPQPKIELLFRALLRVSLREAPKVDAVQEPRVGADLGDQKVEKIEIFKSYPNAPKWCHMVF